jgi:lysophospholipase L1-like esterase
MHLKAQRRLSLIIVLVLFSVFVITFYVTYVNTNPKTGVVIGDSIAEGYPAHHGSYFNSYNLSDNDTGGTFAGEFQNNLTHYKWYNFGVGAQTTRDVRERWNRDVLAQSSVLLPNKTISQKPNVVIVDVGINDCYYDYDVNETENNLYWMAINASQNNIRVQFMTLNPAKSRLKFDNNTSINSWTKINIVNNWMKNNLTRINHYVRVFDAFSVLNDGSGDILSAYSYGDGVHLNQNAYIMISNESHQQNRDLFDNFVLI